MLHNSDSISQSEVRIFDEEMSTIGRCELKVAEIENDEQTPAWIRYLPKASTRSREKVSEIVPTDTKQSTVAKRKFSSNKFGPNRQVVDVESVRSKRKASSDSDMCIDQLEVDVGIQTRKKVYRRTNVDEAAMLLSMFALKK